MLKKESKINFDEGRMLRLNIQMFAEDETKDNDGKGQPKTYSEEEYNKLKSRIDELSKNEKMYKEQLKKKSTDDEIAEQEKQEAQKQKDLLIEQLQNENKKMKISNELATGGYNEKEVKELTDLIIENDTQKLSKYLTNLKKTLIENVTKEVTSKLQKQNKIPNGNDDVDNEKNKILELAKMGSKNKTKQSKFF